MIGYQDTPTFIELVTHFAYVLFICVLLLFADRLLVLRAKDATARLARTFSLVHAVTFFIFWIYTVANPTWNGVLVSTIGLLLSLLATFVAHDLFATHLEGVKRGRRSLGLVCAVGLGLLCLFTGALHIVQCACLEKDCSLPTFFYWGSIFNERWLRSSRTTNSFVPLAVLSVSLIMTVYSFGSFCFVMVLFSLHVDRHGDYLYSRQRVKLNIPGICEDLLREDVESLSLSLEQLASTHGQAGVDKDIQDSHVQGIRASLDGFTAGLDSKKSAPPPLS